MAMIDTQPLFDASIEDGFAFIIVILLIALIFRLRSDFQGTGAGYDPRKAWLRAGVYFCVCNLLSWMAGVMKTHMRHPLITADQAASPIWWGLAAICLSVVAVGYGVIWRKGTRHQGRKLHLAGVLVFGTLWGLSEGQLFLVFWSLPERVGLAQPWVAVIAFCLAAIFLGLWHDRYWDIRVAPDHNIIAWNLRKVLFAHIPNLACALTFLALTGSAAVFVLIQTFALLISTVVMRFPLPEAAASSQINSGEIGTR